MADTSPTTSRRRVLAAAATLPIAAMSLGGAGGAEPPAMFLCDHLARLYRAYDEHDANSAMIDQHVHETVARIEALPDTAENLRVRARALRVMSDEEPDQDALAYERIAHRIIVTLAGEGIA